MSRHTLVMVLIILVISAQAVAQEALTETFTVPDSGLSFQYPEGWSVEVNEDNVIVLTLSRARRVRALITIFSPPVIDRMGFGDETDPSNLVTTLGAFFEDQDGGDLTTIEIGDTAGARYAYINKDDDQPNLLVALPFNEKLVLLWVTTSSDNLDEMGELAVEIAATLTQPATAPQSLQSHNGTWQEAVGELEARGLIAAGGELIFRENRAFFSGQGNWFTPLARQSPRTDVIMAGELRYTPSDPSGRSEIEYCALTARIGMEDNTAVKYLDVGVDSDGDVFYIDRFGDGLASVNQGYETLNNFDFAAPHHYLILALDDRLTIFIDGQIVFENRRIDERTGTYGVTLIGRGPQALCEATNIWAYEAPTFQPGVCGISAEGTINKRSGPGTNFDVAGQLAANVERHAQGQTTGADGFVWWQLDDDTWVRNDVIRARGDCRSVPEVAAE